MHALDTVHLNRSVARATSRGQIGGKLKTPKPCTYAQRQQAKNRLSDSIAWRPEREVRTSLAKYNEIGAKAALAKAIPAVISCYQGNHTLCIKHSLLCDGVRLVYEYLPKFARGNFCFSKQETDQLTTILSKRMGGEALHKTRFGLTTQKAESMNHAFATTNPKHSMTCSRNAANRDHSAIHMVNNPVGDSILKKARACGVPVSPNVLCLAALNQMNRRQAYRRRVSRSKYDKIRRAILRSQRYYLYDTMKNQSYYSKGQSDPN